MFPPTRDHISTPLPSTLRCRPILLRRLQSTLLCPPILMRLQFTFRLRISITNILTSIIMMNSTITNVPYGKGMLT